MKRAIGKVGLTGFATLIAIFLSLSMIYVASNMTTEVSAGDCAVCNGSCGTTGCSYYCKSDPSIKCKRYQARFKCDGRIHTACNENNGVSIGSRPDMQDPENWCKTFQFDSNADNGAYSMVYVGDGGETCVHKGGQPNKCDPDDLDWDCSKGSPVPPPPKPKPPPNKMPACEYLKSDKTKVFSQTEPIKIWMKGTDPDNVPNRLLVYAAAGSQINKNPGNFYCTASSVAHPEYSFYCGGLGSWVLIGSRTNANELSFTTNFKELKAMVNSLNSGYEGYLNNRGISITANVVGSFSNDICSSNIARNNGKGVYYNNGSWNQACDGGCNLFIEYEKPAVPVEPKACNGTCSSDSQCEGDLICSSGYCRNASCTAETDCTCPAKPAEPRCGDNTCNQDSEMCENGKSCSSGADVSCREDCTYCGDGIVNGEEECDYNKDGTTNCTNECKIIKEHPPTDTAGFIDDNLALIGGFGMLVMGAGAVTLAAPLKKRVQFE